MIRTSCQPAVQVCAGCGAGRGQPVRLLPSRPWPWRLCGGVRARACGGGVLAGAGLGHAPGQPRLAVQVRRGRGWVGGLGRGHGVGVGVWEGRSALLRPVQHGTFLIGCTGLRLGGGRRLASKASARLLPGTCRRTGASAAPLLPLQPLSQKRTFARSAWLTAPQRHGSTSVCASNPSSCMCMPACRHHEQPQQQPVQQAVPACPSASTSELVCASLDIMAALRAAPAAAPVPARPSDPAPAPAPAPAPPAAAAAATGHLTVSPGPGPGSDPWASAAARRQYLLDLKAAEKPLMPGGWALSRRQPATPLPRLPLPRLPACLVAALWLRGLRHVRQPPALLSVHGNAATHPGPGGSRRRNTRHACRVHSLPAIPVCRSNARPSPLPLPPQAYWARPP